MNAMRRTPDIALALAGLIDVGGAFIERGMSSARHGSFRIPRFSPPCATLYNLAPHTGKKTAMTAKENGK
jgi:hypothetical protein